MRDEKELEVATPGGTKISERMPQGVSGKAAAPIGTGTGRPGYRPGAARRLWLGRRPAALRKRPQRAGLPLAPRPRHTSTRIATLL